MTGVGRCKGCGALSSEVWGKRDECRECGASIEHIKVDMGYREHLPRVFRFAGLAIVALDLGMIVIASLGSGIDKDILLIALVIMVIGAISFAISLALHMDLSRKAVKKAASMKARTGRQAADRPRQRIVKRPAVTSGEGNRGKKILVGK